MKILFFLFILFNCNYSFAFEAPHYDRSQNPTDDTNVIGISCNEKTDILKIRYFSAYNLPSEPMELWDTHDLKKNKKSSDYVELVHEIVRTCNIDKVQYIIKIRPVPGNWNLNGRCGARTYGGASILKNGVLIFDANFEECGSKEIISNVIISSGQKTPVVTKLKYKEFYKELSQ